MQQLSSWSATQPVVRNAITVDVLRLWWLPFASRGRRRRHLGQRSPLFAWRYQCEPARVTVARARNRYTQRERMQGMRYLCSRAGPRQAAHDSSTLATTASVTATISTCCHSCSSSQGGSTPGPCPWSGSCVRAGDRRRTIPGSTHHSTSRRACPESLVTVICFLSALGVESRLLGVRPVYHDERVLTGRFAALVDLRASIYARLCWERPA